MHNYYPTGDKGGIGSVKQVFYHGGPRAEELAGVLDFYYEMPPIINPLLMKTELKAKYPIIFSEMLRMGRSSRPGRPAPFVFDANAQAMGLYQEPLLDLGVPEERMLFEEIAAVVPHGQFAWYNQMAVMGATRCRRSD